MKLYPTVILIFIYSNIFSATDTTFSVFRNSVSVSTGYYFASNSITNDFAKSYFLNRFIGDDLKSSVEKNLGNKNRFGLGFDFNFDYTRRTDSLFGLKNSFFKITAGTSLHIDDKFSEDLFKVFFRGNKIFENKTADFSDFHYRQYFYQQLGFLCGHTFYDNGYKFNWTAGITVNKGQKLFLINSDRATLYTAMYGDYLDVNANLNLRQSDSSKSSFGDINGFGASVNGGFSWTDRKKNVYSITVSNLGFIKWNSESSYITADSSFRFEGIDVTELFDFKDSVHHQISVDSSLVQPFLSHKSKRSFTSVLPGIVTASFSKSLKNNKYDFEARLSYLIAMNALPLAETAFGIHLHNYHRLIVHLQYGGYASFIAGLGYQLTLDNGWKVTLKSDYLSEMLNAKNGRAQGAFLSLTKYF